MLLYHLQKKGKETGDSQYIYQKELDKACFQHDMAYGDFKNLTRRTAFDKIFRDKAFIFAKNPKYDGYQRCLTSGGAIKNEIISNKELAKKLHKPIIRKFQKRKVHSSFTDNIWGLDLADTQLINKFNKGIRFLLWVIDIFSKYAWVIPLKDKKGITIANAFQKNLIESYRKPNKVWVYKGSEFYNRSMKSYLQNNNTEMYLTHNKEKSVIAETLIRILKNKIYEYMTSISKNCVYW